LSVQIKESVILTYPTVGLLPTLHHVGVCRESVFVSASGAETCFICCVETSYTLMTKICAFEVKKIEVQNRSQVLDLTHYDIAYI